MEGVFLFLLGLAIGGAAVHARPAHEVVEYTYRRLFSNYNRDLLPEYGAGPVVVSHGLILTELRDVDSFRERITFGAWEKLLWNDTRLTHTAVDGLKPFRVPTENIWLPDIVLYQMSDKPVTLEKVRAVIYPNGSVLMVVPKVYTAYCSESTSTTMKCKLTFGSWTYDASLVDVNAWQPTADVTSFNHANRRWAVQSSSAKRVEKKYPCCEETYSSVEYNFILRNQEQP